MTPITPQITENPNIITAYNPPIRIPLMIVWINKSKKSIDIISFVAGEWYIFELSEDVF